MSNKQQETYAAVFQFIHDNVMMLHCDVFMSDYETALRNGFATVVPDACWFHFVQAVKRNAMKLEYGEIDSYGSNSRRYLLQASISAIASRQAHRSSIQYAEI